MTSVQPVHIDYEENDGAVTGALFLSAEGDADCELIAGAGKLPSLMLDFGEKTTVFLQGRLHAENVAALDLLYGPVPGLVRFQKIIPITGVDLSDCRYIACRYLRITPQPADSSKPCRLRFDHLQFVFSAYDGPTQGMFQCDDALLNDVWKTGLYTVRLCLQPFDQSSAYYERLNDEQKQFIAELFGGQSPYVIFDGPRRDREVWLGDIRTEALTVLTGLYEPGIIRDTLDIFKALQREDGLTVGSGVTWQEFYEYNFWYLIAIWDYYFYTGDAAYLSSCHDTIKRMVCHVLDDVDKDGFVYNDKSWTWTLPREGKSSATQCILCHAMQCMSQLLPVLNELELAKSCSLLCCKIKDSINRIFWDEERGVYTDRLMLNGHEEFVPSDVNCYAVVFDIAGTNQKARVLDYLQEHTWGPYGSATLDRAIENPVLHPDCQCYALRDFVWNSDNPVERLQRFMWPHNKQVWPFINIYEIEANLKLGRISQAYELTRRCFGNMLGKTGSFWEMVDAVTGEFPLKSLFAESPDDVYNSAAHGWSGWIASVFQMYVLGVRPMSPGFATALIEPQISHLKRIQGVVPTPKGLICVDINVHSHGTDVIVTAPPIVDIQLSEKFLPNKPVHFNCIN